MLYTCVQLFLFILVLRYSSKQFIMSGSASTLLILNLLIHGDSLTDLPLNICERVTISVFTALVIVMKVTATSILVVLANNSISTDSHTDVPICGDKMVWAQV